MGRRKASSLNGRPDNADCLQNQQKTFTTIFVDQANLRAAIAVFQSGLSNSTSASTFSKIPPGSSLAAALHFCAPWHLPEAISRPEEAQIPNKLRVSDSQSKTYSILLKTDRERENCIMISFCNFQLCCAQLLTEHFAQRRQRGLNFRTNGKHQRR